MNVIVMRRTLSDVEFDALRKLYPNVEINMIRSDPQSAEEHLQTCQRHDANLVFLPHEQPIPVAAMKAGVKHVLLKSGCLHELVEVVPHFKPYQLNM